MRTRVLVVGSLAGLISLGGSSLAAQQPPPPAPVVVPEGDGSPVITDGLFSPGEWDDALRLPLGETVTLHLKQYRRVVFIGVRGQGPLGIGPSELFLAAPGGPLHRLHVSAQLSEAVLTASEPDPRHRFGLTTDWYANEQRRDMEEADRLAKQGRDPLAILRATAYPSDGIEFAIRRSKLRGQVWLMRLWASAFVGGKPQMLAYPAAAAERATDGWLELRLAR